MILPRSTIHYVKINWRSSDLVMHLIRRDFRLRYLGSLFGSYWNLIHPITMILLYTAIFSQMMGARLATLGIENRFAYTIYLCAGLLPWNAFVEMVSRTTRVFLDQAPLIKKVSFPIEVLPTVVIASASFNFAIAFGLLLILCLASGVGISEHIVAVPFIFMVQMLLAAGIGMFTAVLNIFFRDVEQVVGIVMQVWFWMTPIVYLKQSVPEGFGKILLMNPMYYLVEMYHQVIVLHQWPDLRYFGIALASSVVVLMLGANFLSRFKSEIPDEI